jgi:bifunctional DNA-binding transcriptional regulator/antitoxin component of YhaV-PrlF toxin-antitoxin module
MTQEQKSRVVGMLQVGNPVIKGQGMRVTFPKTLIERMSLRVGDFIVILETEGGDFFLEPKKLCQLSKDDLLALIHLRGLRGRPIEKLEHQEAP